MWRAELGRRRKHSSEPNTCQEPHPGNVGKTSFLFLASLVAHMIKNLPAMQDTWGPSLGWEDPLEKGMATHPNILAWRIPWTEETGRIQSTASQRAGHDWATFTIHTHSFYKGRDTLWGEWLETKPRKLFYALQGSQEDNRAVHLTLWQVPGTLTPRLQGSVCRAGGLARRKLMATGFS